MEVGMVMGGIISIEALMGIERIDTILGINIESRIIIPLINVISMIMRD